jgi:hypothetical protein
MPDQYRTSSTSSQSFDVERLDESGQYQRNIILEVSPTGTTRKVMRSLIVRNVTNPQQRCKVVIVHQRKLTGDQWQDVESINLATVRAGDAVKLDLNSAATFQLFEELKNVFQIAESDTLGHGTHDLVVGRAEELISVDTSRAAFIQQLVNAGHSEEVWESLVSGNPDLATTLAQARLQQHRVETLSTFETMLGGSHTEREWQLFFEANQWIFGYGLRYVFLQQVLPQPHYGGEAVTGQGDQRGDFLAATSGNVRFTVLVEIKRPDTALVLEELNRSGCNRLSPDLLDGVNQVQVNCATWENQGSRTEENRELMAEMAVHTIRPRSILVIGDTSQLNDLNKRRAFEGFRSNLLSPEVITFDELFQRAKFIIEHE